jgi:hypothetical protein
MCIKIKKADPDLDRHQNRKPDPNMDRHFNDSTTLVVGPAVLL